MKKKDYVEISLVVDNEANPGLMAEHGFAAWAAIGDDRLLFDTSQTAALAHNASQLGIDLSCADLLVLSHGHYDHTGGLPTFLESNEHATVCFGRGATQRRFSCHPDQPPRSIGMDDTVSSLIQNLASSRRKEITDWCYLYPHVGATGPVPRTTPFEDTGGPFFLDAGKRQVDLIDDDLSLWFETDAGLVILCGCSHAGVINTVQYVRDVSGVERVHGIIGGFHLLQASEERLRETIGFLDRCRPDFLIPCHCTGEQVVERLKSELGKDVVRKGFAGMKIQAGTLG
ncbi:MBL fold metallo-hydrolase [Propionivibrio soli]|uniref:MBL fold metallo-hydrolase n=1 Tax=Propionivibrio soli TaxID=2976531 RepID=UPI0021E7ED61|nr:MBL fold metallo-hydrolase [Propionivibrio soli]